jgi:cytochrome c5
LNSPATTLVLLKANAIVGIKAVVDENNHLTRVGITCALCHSTVDNSVQEGIGRRMDGWPNRQLNVGAIIALSPVLSDQQREVYNSWGPGKYDPRFNQDGKNFPVVLPPAYGLAKIENATYTAEGTISYWNSYVAITQMHGIGKLVGRDGNPTEEQSNQAQPMPAERGDTMSMPKDSMSQQTNVPAPAAAPAADNQNQNQNQQNQDLVTPKLPALRDYQHSLEAPAAPEGSFDQASATRGERVFRRACMSCHVGITGTDNNSTQAPSEVTPGGDVRNARVKGKVHAANETGMDPQVAERSENKGYRTTPLRGLWQHAPYFHDGSAATLSDVVNHYNKTLKLKLTQRQQKDLIEFLKSK